MNEIAVTTIEPFDVHPLEVAEHLYATTPRWRVLRRRRLAREVCRIISTMSLVELQATVNRRTAKLIEAKHLLTPPSASKEARE